MINRGMDICGSSGSRRRSCSKFCLVKVFITVNVENFLKTFAVLEDQPSRSLGHSKLFDSFNVPNNLVPYELKTSNIAPFPKVRTLTCGQLNGFSTKLIISWTMELWQPVVGVSGI